MGCCCVIPKFKYERGFFMENADFIHRLIYVLFPYTIIIIIFLCADRSQKIKDLKKYKDILSLLYEIKNCKSNYASSVKSSELNSKNELYKAIFEAYSNLENECFSSLFRNSYYNMPFYNEGEKKYYEYLKNNEISKIDFENQLYEYSVFEYLKRSSYIDTYCFNANTLYSYYTERILELSKERK